MKVSDATQFPIPIPFESEYPEMLNRWDPFTVSVIEVDVVVVGVEQDEDEFANVDSQHRNIGLELGFSLKTRPIFLFSPRREDRDLGAQFKGKQRCYDFLFSGK